VNPDHRCRIARQRITQGTTAKQNWNHNHLAARWLHVLAWANIPATPSAPRHDKPCRESFGLHEPADISTPARATLRLIGNRLTTAKYKGRLHLEVITKRDKDTITRHVGPGIGTTGNGCRVQTLRVTPAMEAGIADHVWSLEEIINVI